MESIKAPEVASRNGVSQFSQAKRLVAGIALSASALISPAALAGTNNNQSTGIRLMTETYKIDTRNIDTLFEAMISKNSLKASLDHITIIQLANRLSIAVHAGSITQDQARNALWFFATQESRNLGPSINILARVSGTVWSNQFASNSIR